MSAGCPVVSIKKSSIPEVAGDAGLLVDDIDQELIIEKIKSLENEEYRNNIIELGYKQARKFSWLKCCNETLEFYKKVSNKKFKHSNDNV
jgi:mannosyltransferase